MSAVFATKEERKGAPPNTATIQKMLDENDVLIQSVSDLYRAGRPYDAVTMQGLLHRNLSYLACLADCAIPIDNSSTSNPNVSNNSIQSTPVRANSTPMNTLPDSK